MSAGELWAARPPPKNLLVPGTGLPTTPTTFLCAGEWWAEELTPSSSPARPKSRSALPGRRQAVAPATAPATPDLRIAGSRCATSGPHQLAALQTSGAAQTMLSPIPHDAAQAERFLAQECALCRQHDALALCWVRCQPAGSAPQFLSRTCGRANSVCMQQQRLPHCRMQSQPAGAARRAYLTHGRACACSANTCLAAGHAPSHGRSRAPRPAMWPIGTLVDPSALPPRWMLRVPRSLCGRSQSAPRQVLMGLSGTSSGPENASVGCRSAAAPQ